MGASCDDKHSSVVESEHQKAWDDVTRWIVNNYRNGIDGNILSSHGIWWVMPTSIPSWLRTPMRHLGLTGQYMLECGSRRRRGTVAPTIWSGDLPRRKAQQRQRTRLSVLWSNVIHSDFNLVRHARELSSKLHAYQCQLWV